ncbi:MAG: hypothetical protein J6K73_12635 [Clostridia bacterium]|nr:hypothetical protein [Clostridia bacterium]
MKNNQTTPYEEQLHTYGRIWVGIALTMMILAPIAICVYYNAWPPITAVLKALLGVAPMYWTVGIIEVFTYVPMLGTGGSYLGFVTGNLTSLKVPCALNAMEAQIAAAGAQHGHVGEHFDDAHGPVHGSHAQQGLQDGGDGRPRVVIDADGDGGKDHHGQGDAHPDAAIGVQLFFVGGSLVVFHGVGLLTASGR